MSAMSRRVWISRWISTGRDVQERLFFPQPKICPPAVPLQYPPFPATFFAAKQLINIDFFGLSTKKRAFTITTILYTYTLYKTVNKTKRAGLGAQSRIRTSSAKICD
jgi:hypothetical protein